MVQESSGEVREKALLALTGLAVASFQKEEFEDVRNLLGQAAGRGRGAPQRIEVFRALWSAATVCESPELFFGNTRIWGSLCESIEPTEPADVRESALGLLLGIMLLYYTILYCRKKAYPYYKEATYETKAGSFDMAADRSALRLARCGLQGASSH